DDSGLVSTKRDGVTSLAELLFELAVEAFRLAPDPYRLVVTGKIGQLRVRWRKGLHARGQSGLLEHEVLHQAQHRSALRVGVPQAVAPRGRRQAAPAVSRRALNHRDPAIGPPQIIRCHQTVDAGTHDDDVHLIHTY